MTSDELRKLAHYEENSRYGGACKTVVDALEEAADEIDRLTARVVELEREIDSATEARDDLRREIHEANSAEERT